MTTRSHQPKVAEDAKYVHEMFNIFNFTLKKINSHLMICGCALAYTLPFSDFQSGETIFGDLGLRKKSISVGNVLEVSPLHLEPTTLIKWNRSHLSEMVWDIYFVEQ